jgi:hypothetical protein
LSKAYYSILRNAAVPLVISIASSLAMAQEPATRPDATPDLAQQVKELRAQMEQMQIHEQDLEKKLQEQSAKPATVPSATVLPVSTPLVSDAQVMQQALQDANQHSLLLTASPLTAGWDPTKGIYIASDDGDYLLHPFVLLQVPTSPRNPAATPPANPIENTLFPITRFPGRNPLRCRQ